ncbi:MAG: aldose epimerase family protein [Blastocatellia bacterium]
MVVPSGKSNMSTDKKQRISKEHFGETADHQPVDIYTLTNASGAQVRIMTYGASVVSVRVPDRNGELGDVVLGYDTFDGYLKNDPYFGAIVGRYGNRIGNAKFSLNGKEYTLSKNYGENTLHGGANGFGRAVWKAKEVKTSSGAGVSLTYFSKDGEEGFPGNMVATVVYSLTGKNELKIEYTATTDKPTVVNLTNHSYFNLAGSGSILNHVVTINADKFTVVRSGLIPTGELRSVKGTPMDFISPTAIGSRINEPYEQLTLAKGYDHNWVLRNGGGKLTLAATAYDPSSGRVMDVYTTEPGVQFYTGNFLDGTITGKNGQVYKQRYGFCFETQHFPDSPNEPEFPSTVLLPGQTYRTTTEFRFSTK